MDIPTDIKEDLDKEYHDNIMKMVQKQPKRGKSVTIKKRKRPPSEDEISENFYPESTKDRVEEPKMKGRLNEELIDLLDQLQAAMSKKGENFRSRAYKKAQESLITYDKEINETNYKNLESLDGVGSTIIKKFEEYINTGSLRLLEREKIDPKNIFADIFGIGPKKAAELVEKGIKTIDQLKEKNSELNDKQKVGLKYYEDILKRIPRTEIVEFEKLMTITFNEVKMGDSKFEIVGSYRRGAKTSGDIDVIITSDKKEVFKNFIDGLIEKKIITEDGVLSRGPTKSLVVAKLPNSSTARRLDFMYTSKEEYPFATLYFTGSKFFNTVMRGRALTLGYSLNEHGLYVMDGKKKGNKVDRIFNDEKEIFTFLKMEYKEPRERLDGRSVVPLPGTPKLEAQPELENITIEIEEIEKPKKEKKEKKEKKCTQKQKIMKEDMAKMKKIKQEEKTRKKREKQMEKEKAKEDKKKEKELEKIAKQLKKQETQKKRQVKEKKKSIKKNTPLQSMAKSKKPCPPCPPCDPVNKDSNDPILHAIENYKNGGLSVLENLTENTLNAMLVKTNDVYRNLGPNEQPLISDNQYDILEDYIKEKYPKNTVVGKIGAPVEKNKIKLPYEMASMDKIKPDTKALPIWKKKYKGPYVLSCKLDGVSGLYTTEGKKPGLYTRGDGKIGQDVSHFIPYLNLPKTENIVVRGEFIMKKSVFSSKYKDKFANARNLIAGIVNRVSLNETVHDMDFVVYEVIKPVLKPSEQMEKIKELNLICVQNETLENIENEDLSERLVSWRENYDYEIDGVIVCNDEIYNRKSGNPDHSFAFKMVLSEQMAETKVLDVIWTASKDGYLKPRVRIEPVHLSGVKIEYATGFNGAFIENNKIGVGAVIELIRSGDVIPYIRNVITPASQPLMPSVPYIWNDSHVDIMLENKDDDKTVRNKQIFLFFKGIEVDGLGEKNVEKIIEAGFTTIPKILKMTKTQLLSIEGFKEKMAEKLQKGIQEKIQTASLEQLMAVSNMFGRGFSSKKMELIISEYPDVLTSSESMEEKIAKLKDVKGMALKTAKAFVEKIPVFLGFLEDCELSNKLKTSKTVVPTKDESHPLYKKSIVMSGTRDKDLEKKLKEVGAVLGSSVTSKTFAVLTEDVESNSGKVETARKLNIEIYSPQSFAEKYFS